MAKSAFVDENVVKLCENIVKAHCTGAFGGKPVLWGFLQDVAQNLNQDSQGNRYIVNTKCFAQAMKVYGGRRMCNLFALNFVGPNYSTIKGDLKKGVQFLPVEHAEIFFVIVSVCRDTQIVHNIVDHVPVIFA